MIRVLILALAATGCNATSLAEIKAARLAVYDCERTVVEAAVRAELRKYGRVAQEPTEPYAMQTEARWYTKFGQAGVRVARDDDFLRSQGLIPVNDSGLDSENNDAVILAYQAKVLPARGGWRVVTDYAAVRWLRDRQLPEPLGPENASTPRWIDQRVHGIHVKIHRRLRACVVTPRKRDPEGPGVDPTIDEPTPGVAAPKAEPAPEAEAAPEPEPEPAPKTAPEAEPEAAPEAAPEAEPDAEPEAEPEPLPGAGAPQSQT